jgi:hypothetical protein
MRTVDDVAAALRRWYTEGVQDPDVFTDPYVCWHCYDGLDKVTSPGRLSVGKPDLESDRPQAAYDRVDLLTSEGAVTAVLTTRLSMVDGREVLLHSCMVHYLDEEHRIHRIEAYYDPHPLERDAWYRDHIRMYDGIARVDDPYRR